MVRLSVSLDSGNYFCLKIFTSILWKVVVEGIKFQKRGTTAQVQVTNLHMLDVLLQKQCKPPQHIKSRENLENREIKH